jgi:DsbC/DsbD-like thiol-disulfide interchange protein
MLLRLLMGVIAFALCLPASPGNASEWAEAMHSRARLVAAGQVEAERLAGRVQIAHPVLLAGVEIELDPGWKTYWRTPGDGIAAEFDWTGSTNLAAARVLWPAPRHFRDAAGQYNGYSDRVILPIAISPTRPDEPVSVDLRLDYAVCKDVCIPVSKQLSLRLSATDNAHQSDVMSAVAATPVRADADGRCGRLRFAEISARLDGSSPRLMVAITHPPYGPPEDLFAEAASGQFIDHLRRETGADPSRTAFHVDLTKGGAANDLAGQNLTLTAVAAPQSCEMTWTVE